VAIFTPIATALPYLSSSCEIPDLAAQDAAAPGIFSGFLWNIGKLASCCILQLQAGSECEICMFGFSATRLSSRR
jgi:hypothetical protein